jgi:putative cell wall binding repeat protein
MRLLPRPSGPAAACLASAALALSGCGGDGDDSKRPQLGKRGSEPKAAAQLGFPGFATKNTTRVGGADSTANAAAVARAVYPGSQPFTRPAAVAIADSRDWRGALAAAVLMARPIRAPLLLSDGQKLPPATADALSALAPSGSEPAGGARVIRVGDVARPEKVRSTDIKGRDPFLLAQALDAFHAAARGRPSRRVVIVSANAPEFAMPAAAWAAKSGDPILFVTRDRVPPATRAALRTHQQPRIYVLGPSKVISPQVTKVLRRFGRVVRTGDADPITNAIAFARYLDGSFGWGVVDPGHGLVFASVKRPLDAAAAAPLSASGTYGPLLLFDDPEKPPAAVARFLLDVQPGYARDPTRGVYNHGWIVGSESEISIAAQSRIDALLEIVPVNQRGSPAR